MKGEIISIQTARQSGKTYKMLLDMQKENIALRDELKKIKKDLELDENATYGDVEVKIYDDLYKTINEQCYKILDLAKDNLKYERKIKKLNKCIKDFLCTEEYIKVDGKAIADNYGKLLNILESGE